MMRKLLLYLLSFFLLTTTAQISTKNNFLQTKTAGDFFQQQQIKKNGVNRIGRSVQISKTVHVTNAGTLDNLLNSIEKNTITDLAITGTLDARDFRILRDSMVNLTVLDISAVTVVSYLGSEGTGYYDSTYPANEIPEYAFYISGRDALSVISGLTSILLPTTITSIGNNSFTFCSSLKSISIPASVTQIGLAAFVGCSAIIHVDPANPNYSSVDGVLYDKVKTTLLQCPVSIAGNYDIPSTVNSIASWGFCFCNNLTSINVPPSVESIGIYAFTSCSGKINIDPTNKNYTSLDGVLFNKTASTLIQCGTSTSGSYSIPSSVDSIGDNAFYNCNLMSSVSIPSSVISIADYAFYNCSGLASITVNSRPVSLGSSYSAFYQVNTGTCILNVPFGTKSLYQSAVGWSSFINIVEDRHGLILGTNKGILSSEAGSTTSIKISTNDAWSAVSNQSWLKVSPENGTGNDTIVVTADANPSPDNRIAMITVTEEGIQPQTITVTQAGIPSSIKISAGKLSTVLTVTEQNNMINLKITGSMDASDFKTLRDNMPDLTFLDISEVNIVAYNGPLGTANWITTYPANRIPDYAFNNNLSSLKLTLKTVKLPTTINAIGDYAFYLCDALTEIIIPNSVTYIGAGSFGSCNKLENVILPFQLTSIESQAFTGCGFSKITIPNTVKTIGQFCFSNCKNLRSINIPNSVTTISGSAFESCFTLTDLTIGNSVTYIGNSAFSNCSSLTSVVLPNSVTTLDGSVFGSCTKLKTVTLSNSLTTIGYGSFQSCTNLIDITIPNSVTKIDYSAFSNCRSLTTLIIPNSVTSLGNSAFSYCIALTTLTIPNQVTSIGSYAFYGCIGLTSIIVNREVPLNLSASANVFNNVNKTKCILNVPFGAKKLYAVAIQWQDFINIAENIHGIDISTDSVRLGSTVGTKATAGIKSNDPWTVTSNQTWLKVSPDTGIGNDTLRLTADENVSSLKRTALVTVLSGDFSKTIIVIQAAAPKIITITPGGLSSALTSVELSSITDLTINGTIDARDFKTLRDNMPKLENLDISTVNIVAYSGSEGTGYNSDFAADLIPNYAFSYLGGSGKISLITVILPRSAKSIGNSAFEGCTRLVTVVIPSSVVSIGYSAFNSCSSLVNISIPNSMTVIETYTFANCKMLKNITIPNSVTYINGFAFEGDSGLKSIIISNSVTSIGYYAFASCTGLTGITIPNSVTSLSSSVFMNCTELTTVSLPNSFVSIPSSAFQGCSKLTDITIPNTLKLIGSSAFESCTGLSSISIPNSVTKIEGGAFSNCTGLTNLHLGSGLTTIDSGVFSNCTSLTDLLIPSTITWIGSGAFNSCTGLKSIILPNSINRIDDYAFANCSKLNTITLPDSITAITSNLFANCSALSGITIPKVVKSIGSAAFESCTSLTSINIPNSVATIGDNVFNSCTGLINVAIPFSVISIGSAAFKGCIGLTTITIPNSVTMLSGSIFEDCTSLTNINIGNSVSLIEYGAFLNCTALTNVSIPNSVISIENSAFSSCTALKSITLGNSLNKIGYSAFYDCNKLTTITIPGSVTTIGSSAFESCKGLNSIYVSTLTPVDLTSSYHVFYNVDITNCVLNVPYQTKRLYTEAVQWKEFVNIVENPLFLEIDINRVKLQTNGGNNATVKVSSNTSWTVESDQTWLNVSIKSGTGDSLITLTAEENPTILIRTATVTVSATGVPSKTITITQGASTKTVNIAPGGLSSGLTAEELNIVSDLEITGKIDARDFKTMRDLMPSLSIINLEKTDIAVYKGTEGTAGDYNMTYSANEVPEDAFYNNLSYYGKKNLSKIKLPISTVSISDNAFYMCSSLDSIVIPDYVTNLGWSVFSGCTALKSAKIGNSVTKLEYGAFQACTSLVNLIIPNSVTSIGYNAFSCCNSLVNLTIPNSVTTIGYDAFVACTAMTELNIPNSVVTIENSAFLNCTGLKKITFGNSLKTINSDAFNNCSGLTSLTIPNSVTSIGNSAFNLCSGLKTAFIGNSVNFIGSEAFKSCSSLMTVSIPASVTRIDWNAFYSCSGLTSIYAYSTIPVDLSSENMSTNVFYNVSKTNCILYVPTGSKALYQKAVQWKDFTNIIEMITEVPTFTESNINIYPNPVKTTFRVTGLNEAARIILSDINGKQVLVRQAGAGEAIPVSDLAKGIYILRVVTANGTMDRKLIIE